MLGSTIWGTATWLRDPALSWKAKGLLVYIANRPAGEPLTSKRLVSDGADGPVSMRAGLAELIAKGYVRKVEDRRVGYVLTDKATGAA